MWGFSPTLSGSDFRIYIVIIHFAFHFPSYDLSDAIRSAVVQLLSPEDIATVRCDYMCWCSLIAIQHLTTLFKRSTLRQLVHVW